MWLISGIEKFFDNLKKIKAKPAKKKVSLIKKKILRKSNHKKR